MNEFQNTEKDIIETSYYLSPTKITDLFVHCIIDNETYTPILTSEDMDIKVLKGD